MRIGSILLAARNAPFMWGWQSFDSVTIPVNECVWQYFIVFVLPPKIDHSQGSCSMMFISGISHR